MDVDGEIKVASIAKVEDKEASEETPVSEKRTKRLLRKRRNNTASQNVPERRDSGTFLTPRLGKGRKT